MKTYAKWLQSTVFLAGVIAIVMCIISVYKISDPRIYQVVRGFYEEREESLDGVYIGASNVYSYWQAPIGWGEYGITIYPMSVPNMPAKAVKYMIEECRKTQPDALYIINLNSFKDTDFTEVHMHNTLDHLPFSATKVRMIEAMCEEVGFTGLEKLEFYLPFIRFHSGWNEMTKDSFDRKLEGLKAGSKYFSFVETIADLSGQYRETDETVRLNAGQEETLEELLQYCKETQVQVLFVVVPQVIQDESVIGQLNSICNVVQESGFDVLNLMHSAEDIGLNFAMDLYNKTHVNVHGSLKFMRFMAPYLKDTYGFEDKRGNSAYADWDKAYTEYLDEIDWYTIDFEQTEHPRDYNLDIPAGIRCVSYNNTCTVSWDAVEGAEGYWVYRRYDDGHWSKAAELDASELCFTDQDLKVYGKYVYTVVPVSYQEGVTYFGDYLVNKEAVTIYLNAPELVALQESEAGITISWNPVDGAAGYYVQRKIPGQDWIRLATVENECIYTDIYTQQNVPYLYTVVPFDEDENEGYFDEQGLLRMADLESPTVAGTRKDNHCTIFWNAVKGAAEYVVYQQNEQGEWVEMGRIAAADPLAFSHTCEETDMCVHKISAVLHHGTDVYAYDSESIIMNGGDT